MHDTFEVEVRGGRLHVGRWTAGDQTSTVVAVHGITGNHLAWGTVARKLNARGITVVAPDLRGRGDSNALPGPFGMATHAEDVTTLLDHLGIQATTIVGHSMGAFVAATVAATHPERTTGVVLVDGGLPLAIRTDVDVDEALEASIGPAVARLRMTFEDRHAYHDFWQQHPAFASEPWTPDIEAYVDHDLAGSEPELRSKVNPRAVSEDGKDLLTGAGDAATHASCPIHLLWADHGMLGQPGGLYDEERLAALAPAGMPTTKVAGANHYSIIFAETATDTVADAVAAVATTTAAAARR